MSNSQHLRGAEILIVDDLHENLNFLEAALEEKDFQLSVATSGLAALKVAELSPPNLILLDVMMPGIDGFETCRRLKEMKGMKEVPVIFVTAKNETPDLAEGFRSGGVDYLVKPINTEELMVRIETHLTNHFLTRQLSEANAGLEVKNQELARKNEELERESKKRRRAEEDRDLSDGRLSLVEAIEAERWGIDQFIGTSQTLKNILNEIQRLHRADSTTVLINGESGTGKELVARAIHCGGSRASKAFIPVNCAAVPAELAESLFFGHTKGSFSGANRDQKGYFELADGGTLFLDEVGEMPLPLQAKLLRVLEDGAVLPIGSTREKKVDVRVLAASNVDFKRKIAEKGFREDLYYRLAGYTVHVPTLRERKEDVPILADHFLRIFSSEMGRSVLELSPKALDVLKAYDFPGNVRELKSVMERAMIECDDAIIQPQHLRLRHEVDLSGPNQGDTPTVSPEEIVQNLPLNLGQAEELLIHRALKETQGNISKASRLLGCQRSKVYQYLSQMEK